MAVASEKRQEAPLSDVPTWRERGDDVVWGAWRGVLGPKGLSDAQTRFWEDKHKQEVSNPARKLIARNNYWCTEYLNHEQTAELLKNARGQYRKTIKVLGPIK